MTAQFSVAANSTTRATRSTSALIVGALHASVTDISDPQPDGLDLHHCENHSSISVAAVEHKVQWIVCGFGFGDQEIASTVSGVRAVHPSVRLAVLGEPEDWRRCDSWLRRGCQVYLDAGTSLGRMYEVLVHAQDHDVTIAAAVFQRHHFVRRTAGVPQLTPREFDVLERLKQGLMNREIAGILHITENTVEYHMRNLLQKLGARNRLEVVERATALGI